MQLQSSRASGLRKNKVVFSTSPLSAETGMVLEPRGTLCSGPFLLQREGHILSALDQNFRVSSIVHRLMISAYERWEMKRPLREKTTPLELAVGTAKVEKS